MTKHIRIATLIILALAIILSCTVVGNKLTDPASYSHTIEVLDNNRKVVLGLSAASAAASAAVSALPSDVCSPMAEELSEFTTWFMLILSILYLEKYLLTIFGSLTCYILFPLGFGALLVHCFFPRAFLRSLGTKLVAFGVALLLVIPTSVWISDQINAIYSESIEITVQSADVVSDSLIGAADEDNMENASIIDEAKAILDDASNSVAGVIEQFKNVLNRFLEATAVMLVTSCLIPLLVILFFVWLIKTLFNVQIIVPAPPMKPKRKLSHHEEEYDYE